MSKQWSKEELADDGNDHRGVEAQNPRMQSLGRFDFADSIVKFSSLDSCSPRLVIGHIGRAQGIIKFFEHDGHMPTIVIQES